MPSDFAIEIPPRLISNKKFQGKFLDSPDLNTTLGHGMDIYLPKTCDGKSLNILCNYHVSCFKIKRIRFHWLRRIQRSVQHKTLKLQSLTCKGQRTFLNSGNKTHQNVK